MTTNNYNNHPEVIKLDAWVELLRSDKYIQGQKRLKAVFTDKSTGESTTKHCCLGVLCEMSDEFVEIKPRGDTERFFNSNECVVATIQDSHFITQFELTYTHKDYRRPQAGYLPTIYQQNTFERYISDIYSCKLISMNDEGKTFKEIADYIENTIRPEFIEHLSRVVGG